jgi:hypothetical protein
MPCGNCVGKMRGFGMFNLMEQILNTSFVDESAKQITRFFHEVHNFIFHIIY